MIDVVPVDGYTPQCYNSRVIDCQRVDMRQMVPSIREQ